MKRLFVLLIICFTISVAIPTVVQSQNLDQPGITVPATDTDPIGLGEAVSTVGGAILLIMSVTGWLKQTLNWQGKVVTYLSWIVSLVVCLIGWFLKIGIFDFAHWWFVPIYTLLLGLAANKIFDEKWVNWLLVIIRAQLPSTKITQ